jgi:autotransporter family porin
MIFIRHKGGEKMNKQKITKENNLIMFGMVILGLVVIFAYGMGNVSAAPGNTIYVNGSSGNDAWNGLNSTWIGGTNGPKKTIKNATGTVKSNGIVRIDNGTYKENNININKNMSILGENQQNTIINGLNSGKSIFIITKDVNVSIANLILTNGTSFNGGAINNNGTLSVASCTFKGNTANNTAGAIYNDGTLTINKSTFIYNKSIYDAAGAIYNDGTLIVNNSIFDHNTVCGVAGTNGAPGGAIFSNTGTKLTVNNSTFNYNTVNGGLGGAISAHGRSILTNCTFNFNTATLWGGAIDTTGILTITNTIFNHNTVSVGGAGAIINMGGTLTITNSTFQNNAANGSGEGGAIVSTVGGLNTPTNGEGSSKIKDADGILTITKSTFQNNSAKQGGAIDNDGNSAHVNFNRIIGNTASKGIAIYNNNDDDSTVDATLNWWGSNNNPSKYVSGNVNVKPWMVLTIKKNTTTIQNGDTSTLTTNLLYDNLGKYHNPVDGTYQMYK